MDFAVFEKYPAMVDDEETVVRQVGGVLVKVDRAHDGEIVGFADATQRGDERAVYGLRVVGRVAWVIVTSGDQTFRQQQYPCMIACRSLVNPLMMLMLCSGFSVTVNCPAATFMFRIRAFVSALLRFG